MSDNKYIVQDYDHCLGHLIEECGEVLAAAGKTLRWGWASTNPELPPEEQESNIVWLQREMADLKAAIERMQKICDDGELP
jgi:hypothetical protein